KERGQGVTDNMKLGKKQIMEKNDAQVAYFRQKCYLILIYIYIYIYIYIIYSYFYKEMFIYLLKLR
ncbi:MAG: hypothetical protein MCS20_01010, partial [Candidatus Phytoplasma mali]|nr:hypothetical protein [Candidatus Phytoplasma australiense]MBZ7920032.1 hypothetical protein [Candidatus Karelsulcia muelleri]MCG7201980.1 hypothetical protein [Candidatus Phytoplasma mali]MCZ8631908.1 hypothetical protein [Spiroplasma sp. Tabriz.8]